MNKVMVTLTCGEKIVEIAQASMFPPESNVMHPTGVEVHRALRVGTRPVHRRQGPALHTAGSSSRSSGIENLSVTAGNDRDDVSVATHSTDR